MVSKPGAGAFAFWDVTLLFKLHGNVSFPFFYLSCYLPTMQHGFPIKPELVLNEKLNTDLPLAQVAREWSQTLMPASQGPEANIRRHVLT